MLKCERHHIKKEDSQFKAIDRMARKAGRLWNRANYEMRQLYFKIHKDSLHQGKEDEYRLYSFYELEEKAVGEKWREYQELPEGTAKEVLKSVERAWLLFFKEVDAWKKDPERRERPGIPRYKKHKKCEFVVKGDDIEVSKYGTIHFRHKARIPSMHTTKGKVSFVRFVPGKGTYTVDVVTEEFNLFTAVGDFLQKLVNGDWSSLWSLGKREKFCPMNYHKVDSYEALRYIARHPLPKPDLDWVDDDDWVSDPAYCLVKGNYYYDDD